ncbi:RNA polymerase sigma-70 factor [Bacteroides acidifaciens]|uniref:RNA polymerase sigma-70 factor n=1 Tax=Bacteroides acidifaciens TaxID=85831 RepID=UPI00242DACB6|nr:RNA polymerase sigma-70 factor [Bacteroides acidifaciens]
MLIETNINLPVDEDKVLWYSISRGDKKAFNDLFMKYYTLLYGYSRCYVSAEDAEEVLQEMMVWLWENRKTFVLNTTSSLRSYLFTSVKHRCLNVLRRQEKERDEVSTWFGQEQDAFYEFIDLSAIRELKILIQEAIAELPSSYREVFIMHRFHNKTRPEIAKMLNVSVKTVDYRIQHSLKILRVKLKDYLFILAIYGFIL